MFQVVYFYVFQFQWKYILLPFIAGTKPAVPCTMNRVNLNKLKNRTCNKCSVFQPMFWKGWSSLKLSPEFKLKATTPVTMHHFWYYFFSANILLQHFIVTGMYCRGQHCGYLELIQMTPGYMYIRAELSKRFFWNSFLKDYNFTISLY